MTKRIFAMILCIIMTVPFFAGCSTYDPDEDLGETINIYLGNEIYDFDPAYAYRSNEAMQFTRLLFAGLFYIDEDGKLQKDLVKKYKIEDDEEQGVFNITFDLKETYWSDGSLVSAKDILFAWKRILDPTSVSDAAALLYEIRNAYDAKNGNCSVDDIGVYAIDSNTLQIAFDQSIDYKDFLYNLASPCLVPVRQTAAEDNADWAKRPYTAVCSGPFLMREVEYGKSLTLERNSYYLRNRDKDSIKKFVTPYRLVIDYTKNAEKQLEAYENGQVSFIGDIALNKRADYKDTAKVYNALSTLSCYFNLDNDIFANADTRKALSSAIDRDAIAEKLVFAEAATALVPTGVFEAKSAKKSFRSVGGDLIANDVQSTGKFSGEFTLSIADNEVHTAVAEMLKSAWEKLGFKVEIVKLATSPTDVILPNEEEPTKEFVNDDYLAALKNGSFDIILADVSALDTDAFSMLAPYAAGYSGRDIKFTIDSHVDAVNITGYNSEAYNALIDNAFAEEDVAKRASILHDAEKLLMEDLPVCPIVFTKKAVLSSSIKDVEIDYFANSLFEEAKLK